MLPALVTAIRRYSFSPHLLTLVLLGLSADLAQAQVWRHVDENGITHYTNTRPAHGQLIIEGPATAQELPAPDVQVASQARRTVAAIESKPLYRQIQPQLLNVAQNHGVDHRLVKAVAAAESAFDPLAVSHKGAVGLMQIMPATARRYGVQSEPGLPVASKLKQPHVNMDVGVRYLADLLRLYPGRLDLVLAAYNAGEGAVARAGHNVPNYRETQTYVQRVLALYQLLQSRG